MKKLIIIMIVIFYVQNLNSQSLYWQSCSDMPDVRRNHACCYLDGKVYVLGGYNSNTIRMNSNFEYDTLTNSWTSKTPMSHSRSNLGAVALNNKIYVIGGDPFLTSIEEFNPDSNSWTEKQPMPTGRQHHGCAVVNNKIYAIGGLKSGWTYSNANEVYDPDSNSWKSMAPLPYDRELFGIASLDNNIYIFGGTDGTNLFSTTLCYNTITDNWVTKASMPSPRFGFGTAVINNKIYIIGGGGINGNSTSSVDVYDPATNQWQSSSNMQTPRKLTNSTGMNGKIFTAGGANNSISPYKSAEIGSISLTGIDQKNLSYELEFINVYASNHIIYTDFIVNNCMQISVIMYDSYGRLIKNPENKECIKGRNNFETNLNLSDGMYFVVLQTEQRSYIRKFLIVSSD